MLFDIASGGLGLTYPLQAVLLGDAKVTLQKLIAAVGSPCSRGEWLGRAQSLVREYREESDRARGADAVPIRPERICKEISDWLPEGGVVLSDTGHSGMWTGQMIRLTRPGQRFLRCAGSLGWGFPATLGAKCALPDRPVIGFCGDGGFYYHLAELETAARFDINAIMLVNNNYALNQEKHLFDAAYKGQQLAPITVPSGSRNAEAFRVVGMVSPEALRGFRRAFRVTPRATTSRSAAMNSRVSSTLMKRDSDCSRISSLRNPRSV